MNMQSGAVHNTGRTVQMNAFNVHSVVDHAWNRLVNVSVGNISEHRRMGEHTGWKNEHFCTRVLQYCGGKKRKDFLSQQFLFGTVESCSAEMISNASLAFKASEVIHPSCGWCHCALKSSLCVYVWFFSLQNVLIYVGGCSFSWGNCQCCWTCAALCITLRSDTRHRGWERLVSQVMRVITAPRSSHFQYVHVFGCALMRSSTWPCLMTIRSKYLGVLCVYGLLPEYHGEPIKPFSSAYQPLSSWELNLPRFLHGQPSASPPPPESSLETQMRGRRTRAYYNSLNAPDTRADN